MPFVVPLVALALYQTATDPTPAVFADPNPALPGQTVNFYVPKEAKKVLVSGGTFKGQQDVTGTTPITDKPLKTTTYKFDLSLPKTPTGAGKPSGLVQVQKSVSVHVYEGTFPKLATYFDTRNWKIDVVNGWNRYAVPSTDPVNNAVLYFQPEEDSPDRIAVAIVPVNKDTDSAGLMRQVLAEAPSQYDVFLDVKKKDTIQCGLPASWVTFKGIDQALPGIPTRSMILALVHDGHGYVVSGRTRENDYSVKERLLRCLVRSFAFAKSPPRKPAPAPAKGDATTAKKPASKASGSAKPEKQPADKPGKQKPPSY